jgi:hypothetical protein
LTRTQAEAAHEVAPAAPRENLSTLLSDYAQLNYQCNSFSRRASAAKKALHAAMIREGITDTSTVVQLEEGKLAEFRAEISAPEEEVISVEKLRELVDDETFMKIIRATKTATVEHAGTNIAMRATVTQRAKEDLRIKEVKG